MQSLLSKPIPILIIWLCHQLAECGFKREILRYGQDCQVISPSIVRDAIAAEVNQMQQHYNS